MVFLLKIVLKKEKAKNTTLTGQLAKATDGAGTTTPTPNYLIPAILLTAGAGLGTGYAVHSLINSKKPKQKSEKALKPNTKKYPKIKKNYK